MEEKIFETAIRKKYRYPFKGLITTEDLWDLSLKDLDNIFKVLNKQKKEEFEESLLSINSNVDIELETKINIIKYIVKTKKQEMELIAEKAEKRAEKEKLLGILASKKEKELQDKSIEELVDMIKNLD